MARLEPRDAAELAAMVADSARSGRRLEVLGRGSRRGYGGVVEADAVLDVSGLSGVVDYQPEELVLTARPGTAMAEIGALLAANGQGLAFEPPDLAPLWGHEPGAGTLGGCFATGLSGPRRVFAGAARDHLLGFAAVNGRGEVFHAGGKVLKNVTGFDLPKLMTGSMGTLAVLTEMSVKVLPVPPETCTLALRGLDATDAVEAMRLALAGGVAVTGAAHGAAHGVASGEGETWLRLEGTARALAAQRDDLAARVAGFGTADVIEGAESRALWARIGAASAVAGEALVWRVALPATAAAGVIGRLGDVCWQMDWGGALLWVGCKMGVDVRGAIAGIEGAQATLVRGPEELRLALTAMPPVAAGVAMLSERVRQSFDPCAILNPGRR